MIKHIDVIVPCYNEESSLDRFWKESGEAFVSTVLFDNESTVIHDRLPLGEVPPMTEKEYFTRGCTALLYAVG